MKRIIRGIVGIAHKAEKAAKEVATTVQQKVEEQGGLGKIVENAVGRAGATVGKGVGYARQKLYDQIHETAEGEEKPDYVKAGEAKGRRVATKAAQVGTGVVNDIADVVQGAANAVTREVREASADFKVSPSDREITVGVVTYQIMGDTKTGIAASKAYLTQVSKQIPSRASGRDQVLQFIAAYAIKDHAGFQEAWQRHSQPDVKARSYMK